MLSKTLSLNSVSAFHFVGYIENDDQYMVVASLDNNAVAVVGFVVAVDVDNISGYDLLLVVLESLFCKFQKPVPQASAGETFFPLYSFTMWRCDENKGKYKIVNYSRNVIYDIYMTMKKIIK